jgi:hypothetical protein
MMLPADRKYLYVDRRADTGIRVRQVMMVAYGSGHTG